MGRSERVLSDYTSSLFMYWYLLVRGPDNAGAQVRGHKLAMHV